MPVRAVAAQCRADLLAHPADAHLPLAQRAHDYLDRVEALTAVTGKRTDRWGARGLETSWAHVHHVRALLPLVVPRHALVGELAHAQSLARRYLQPTDDVRRAVESKAITDRITTIPPTGAHQGDDMDRHTISRAVEAAYSVNDGRFTSLRSWRNRLWTATGCSVLFAALVALLTWRWGDLLPLGPPAVAATPAVPALQVSPLMVMLIGALGGFLTAVAAVRTAGPTSSAYTLTPPLGLLRLPVGALTALLGVMLMQSGTVPGLETLTTTGAVAAASLLFGISQELLVRLVDGRARAVEANAVRGAAGTSTTTDEG